MSPVKIAISGKGGVGKTTLASTLARLMGRRGREVVLVDCDPAPNLAISLGIPVKNREEITPLCHLYDLLAERTGVRPGESKGKMYTLNPKVDDLLGEYGVNCEDNVILLVLGTIKTGGGGCFCPESALLRRLMSHLVRSEDVLIMDMEAGVEHLGRGTTRNIDLLLVVVEPGMRSVETAGRIKGLAEDLGISRIGVVINKSRDETDIELIKGHLHKLGMEVVGHLPHSESVRAADLHGQALFDRSDSEEFIGAVGRILDGIFEMADAELPGSEEMGG